MLDLKTGKKKRQAADPHCTHIYFTGASGNITAGKYNDGSPESRNALTEGLHAAMLTSEKSLEPRPIDRCQWVTDDILPQVNPVFAAENQMAMLQDGNNLPANRIRPAMRVSWIDR